MKYDKNQIIDKFDNAKKILIGIGNEFSVLDGDGNYNENKAEEVLAAYNVMAKKLGEKDYYILTLCTDELIYKSELDSDRIVAPCGSIGRLQCPKGCDNKIYDEKEKTCSVCGESLVPNTVNAPTYVEEGYLTQWGNYTAWLQKTLNREILIFDLGSGIYYPSVLRFPFEKVTFYNNKANLVRINESISQIPQELADKAYNEHYNAVEYCKNGFVEWDNI